MEKLRSQLRSARTFLRNGWVSHAAFPETTITAEHRTTREPRHDKGSGTSELGSCAIFADECGEAHNLLPLKEPVDLGVKRGGDCLP